MADRAVGRSFDLGLPEGIDDALGLQGGNRLVVVALEPGRHGNLAERDAADIEVIAKLKRRSRRAIIRSLAANAQSGHAKPEPRDNEPHDTITGDFHDPPNILQYEPRL